MRPFWAAILIVIGAALIFQALRAPAPDRIPYSQFRALAETGQLVDVQIKGDAYIARGTADPGTGAARTYRTGRIEDAERELLARLDEKHVPYTRLAEDRGYGQTLIWVLPLVGAFAFAAMMMKKAPAPTMTNPALALGKNRARLYIDKGTPVTFQDVAGSAEAKLELAEIVEFLRAPERFKRLGARVPKGVLLVGPPGTGKTLLAKAVAGEARVPFFSICGSEFVEMFVGVGAARVRDLFAQAREKTVSIVFIDELDAVGKARGIGGPVGGNDEREQTLNQLLTEMDGFEGKEGMIVLAATNRPEILDTALLRPGRFDRRVHVDRPDREERREILEVHARKVRMGPGVSLAIIAAETTGLAGADLANIVNEAALLAARRNGDAVEQGDLDESIERAVAGLSRKGRRLGARERVTVAYHEAGHALMAEMLPSQDPVRKVSIIPRGPGALGYTMQQPREDRYLMGRQEILDRIVVLLGGRVAEELTIGEISTGAQDDLLNATDLARRMVRELGMSDTVGLVSFEPPRGTMAFQERYGGSSHDYSDETARSVDSEVARILGEAQVRARALMKEHRPSLERIALRLLEAEVIGGDEIRALIAEAQASPQSIERSAPVPLPSKPEPS